MNLLWNKGCSAGENLKNFYWVDDIKATSGLGAKNV